MLHGGHTRVTNPGSPERRPDRRALLELPGSAAALRVGLALTGADLPELWLDCVAHGARISLDELWLALSGRHELAPVEHNIAAATLNARLAMAGLGRPVAYFGELTAELDPA
jgi:hypothetical protein